MRPSKSPSNVGRWLALAAVALAFCATPALAGDVQSFQFTDAFYLEKGLDPTTMFDKYVFPDAKFAVCDGTSNGQPPCRTKAGVSPDPDVYNDVRITEVTGGFQHNGDLFYYLTPAKVLARDFLNNAAGAETRQICDDFLAFLFPKKDGPFGPVGPQPPNRRQDNVFADTNGYFSNNPLGCWRLTFVAWDGPAVNGEGCQDFMDKLVQARLGDSPGSNGLDTDGTPIIRTVSEINKGEALGCLTIRKRDADSTANPDFPWVV